MEDVRFNIEPISDEEGGYGETIPHPRLCLIGVTHLRTLLPEHLHNFSRILETDEVDVFLHEDGPYFESYVSLLQNPQIISLLGKKIESLNIDSFYFTHWPWLMSIEDRNSQIEYLAWIFYLTSIFASIDTNRPILGNVLSSIGLGLILSVSMGTSIRAKILISQKIVKLQQLFALLWGVKNPVPENRAFDFVVNSSWVDFVATARTYFMGYKILEHLEKYPNKKICAVMGSAHASFLHNKLLYPEGVKEIRRKARRYWKIYRLFYGDFYPEDYIK